jgi:hypothetical protein
MTKTTPHIARYEIAREFASSDTRSLNGCGFLVTPSGCHHLNGLEEKGTIEHLVVIVWYLRLIDCEGVVLNQRKITKSNSSGLLRASWSAIY